MRAIPFVSTPVGGGEGYGSPVKHPADRIRRHREDGIITAGRAAFCRSGSMAAE